MSWQEQVQTKQKKGFTLFCSIHIQEYEMIVSVA